MRVVPILVLIGLLPLGANYTYRLYLQYPGCVVYHYVLLVHFFTDGLAQFADVLWPSGIVGAAPGLRT